MNVNTPASAPQPGWESPRILHARKQIAFQRRPTPDGAGEHSHRPLDEIAKHFFTGSYIEFTI